MNAATSTTWDRRWLRPRRIVTLLACGVALWLAWQLFDIITGKPQPTIDYATQFYELCSNAQPEGENTWPLLERVLSRLEEVETQLMRDPMAVQYSHDAQSWPGTFDDLLYGRPTAPNLQPHLRLLRVLHEEGTFSRLSELAAMSRCVRPRVEDVSFNKAYLSATMPHNARVRRLARLQMGRLVVAAESWDWPAVAEITEQSLGIFQLVSRQPSLYEFLAAESSAEGVLRELRTTLVERPLDEGSAQRLLKIVESHRDWPAPEYTMSGERLLRLDNIQNEYTPSGRMPLNTLGRFSKSPTLPDGLTSNRSIQLTWAEVVAITIPGRDAAVRLDARYIDDIVQFANANDPETRSAIDDEWRR